MVIKIEHNLSKNYEPSITAVDFRVRLGEYVHSMGMF